MVDLLFTARGAAAPAMALKPYSKKNDLSTLPGQASGYKLRGAPPRRPRQLR
jgi:hypothetical protein